jgi:hypothetical protein
MKRFYFHYNKLQSQKQNKPIMTLHHNNQCLFVEEITCSVPVQSKINKRQPRVVIQGFSNNVRVKNKKAIIS